MCLQTKCLLVTTTSDGLIIPALLKLSVAKDTFANMLDILFYCKCKKIKLTFYKWYKIGANLFVLWYNKIKEKLW